MTGFYEGLQSTASDLLTKFGKPLTLRIQTGASFDPATQTNTPVFASFAVSGLVLDYKGRTNEGGTFVQTDDKRLLVSVSTAPIPTTGAQIVDGSTVYVVQSVRALSPAGINLLFELQGRA